MFIETDLSPFMHSLSAAPAAPLAARMPASAESPWVGKGGARRAGAVLCGLLALALCPVAVAAFAPAFGG